MSGASRMVNPCSSGEVEPHDFCSGGETIYEMRLHSAMMLSGGGYDRRCIMAVSVQQIHPIAHLPLVLGVLRRLEVATVIDRLIPPHPAHGLSCGRGVEALVLAILDGDHEQLQGNLSRKDFVPIRGSIGNVPGEFLS